MTVRIAMWSGPRNISTAMMRAWENRADCEVVDEPLYASYLAATGIDHPMRDDVLASQPGDVAEAVAAITTSSVAAALQYQKHMTHHVLADADLTWLSRLRHAFLIRDPRRVVASYAKKRGRPTLDDLGYPQQLRIYEHLRAIGRTPPVLVAEDVLRAPRGALCALCRALDVPFDGAMLHWPAGPRASDGVWARHWYGAVWRSTGFEPPRAEPPALDDVLAGLAAECTPYFERLFRDRLQPSVSDGTDTVR